MVRARDFLEEACECCGQKYRLAIHHINEDWRDERVENMQTLCVHCHQQWHGLHRKLGLKCFTRMPPLRDLPVTTYSKIVWGSYAPTATRSTRRRRQLS